MTNEHDGASIGRIEPTELRSVWGRAEDFFAWLADNLDWISALVGLSALEAVRTEHPAGAFSLDILAETDAGELVAIENQFTQSDHDNLGKYMTYAAGVEARAVARIAPAFREEHRAAVDWFDLHSDPDVGFFAIQVSMIRIGNSLPAPLFETVARPNDWQRSNRASIPEPSRRKTFEAFEDLMRSQCGEGSLAVVRSIRECALEAGAVDAFSAKTWYPVWDRGKDGGRIWPCGVFAGASASYPNGSISIPFKDLSTRTPLNTLETLDEFRKVLVPISGFEALPPLDDAKHPSVPLGTLFDETAWNTFMSAVNWFAKRVRSADIGRYCR